MAVTSENQKLQITCSSKITANLIISRLLFKIRNRIDYKIYKLKIYSYHSLQFFHKSFLSDPFFSRFFFLYPNFIFFLILILEISFYQPKILDLNLNLNLIKSVNRFPEKPALFRRGPKRPSASSMAPFPIGFGEPQIPQRAHEIYGALAKFWGGRSDLGWFLKFKFLP